MDKKAIDNLTHKIIGCAMKAHNTVSAILTHALLINFGGLSLEFNRVYNKKMVNPVNHKIK